MCFPLCTSVYETVSGAFTFCSTTIQSAPPPTHPHTHTISAPPLSFISPACLNQADATMFSCVALPTDGCFQAEFPFDRSFD